MGGTPPLPVGQKFLGRADPSPSASQQESYRDGLGRDSRCRGIA